MVWEVVRSRTLITTHLLSVNMALQKVTIRSIDNGEQVDYSSAGEGQYLQGLGIDPDMPMNATTDGTASGVDVSGGAITPVSYAEFSGSEVNKAPMWILQPPQNSLLYTYLNNGKVISYNSSLGSETLVGTPTSGAGNGAVYYADYLYFATPTDISRYGPLSGSPSLSNTVWTSTFGLTALTNTTYPSVGSTVVYPNHAMHVHVDNKVYICDYVAGRGLIHFIKTAATGGTNDGSTYNALDLPQGYLPTDIESYGNDIAISCMYVRNGDFVPGKGAVFFWDTLSDSFYRKVDVSEGAVTALLNKNGQLYAFAGNLGGATASRYGLAVLRYAGGNTFEQIDYVPYGRPPLAGAIDSYGNRISWGAEVQQPDSALVIQSIGGKDSSTPSRARHNTARLSPTASNLNVVSAAKYVQSASGLRPRLIAGWETSNTGGTVQAWGLDSFATSNDNNCYFRGPVLNIGQKFRIAEMRLTLGKPVDANTDIDVFIYYDTALGGALKRVQLPSINSTYFSGKTEIVYKGPTITNADVTLNSGTKLDYTPSRDFFVELQFDGDNTSVMFPITAIIDTIEE